MKNRNYLFFLIFGISLCFISCSVEDRGDADENNPPNGDPPPIEAVSFKNVSYGSNAQQVYDIYLPEGRTDTTTKVVMLIHGGGWTEGDKDDMENFVALIQREHPNHAIVNVNYVLASVAPPVTAFPNQFLDIQAVIQKITSEKESLQILPEFGFIGTSAGAHIALMYDFVYDTSDQVKFVANIVGPTDFTDPFYAEDPNFAIALSLLVDESQYPEGTNYAEATSPVYQVTTSSSPAALFYGDQDPLVPLSNGVSLEEALTDAQITHSFTIYNGGHRDDWSVTDILNLQTQISEYIDIYLPYNN